MLTEFPPRLDPHCIAPDRLNDAEQLVRRCAKWMRRIRYVLPYGWWRTPDGGCVLFDRHYRPVFRLAKNGCVLAVNSDDYIPHTAEVFIHTDATSPIRDADSRKKLAIIIAGLHLEDEIVRRIHLTKNKKLPRWNGAIR